jgi:hypothetical protein
MSIISACNGLSDVMRLSQSVILTDGSQSKARLKLYVNYLVDWGIIPIFAHMKILPPLLVREDLQRLFLWV